MHKTLRIEILKNFDTQADFAIAVGDHESKVSHVIRGRRKLSKDDAANWAKALGCKSSLLRPVTQ